MTDPCPECLKQRSACVLHQTLCIYCQREFASPKNLQRHVDRKHPDTYIAEAMKRARNRD